MMGPLLLNSNGECRWDRWSNLVQSCAQKLAYLLLILHGSMLAYIALGNSPNCDEVGHLTSGLHAWETGTFHLYRVNPPLVRMLAALPAYLGHPKTNWSKVADGPHVRPEWSVGIDFIEANGLGAFWYFNAGRLLCVSFAVLGAWYCFCWGRRLYSPQAGLVAMLMWSFSPTVLGWGSTFTPDAACTSLGLASAYHFLSWLEHSTSRRAFIAGLMLGLAEVAKTTWVILFVIYPVIWYLARRRTLTSASFRQMLAIVGIAIVIINSIYGYEGTFTPLGKYTFVSRTLAGKESIVEGGAGGNRFSATILASIPVPLPYNYVRGIDLQKVDFEQGMESFFWGTWSRRGWWYYYIAALSLKEPLGFLFTFVIAVCLRVNSKKRMSLAEIVLLVPAVSVLILVSYQCGFARYIRYMLPCLPAMCVFSGSALEMASRKAITCGIGILLVWGIASSASIYPYSLSYFNELAGGPKGGWRYLLDANVDWGQDLLRLKSWLAEQDSSEELYVVHMGFVKAEHVGITSKWPIRWPSLEGNEQQIVTVEPPPGVYVISLNELFSKSGHYRYLQKYRPIDRIGYSMWVYRIP